MITSFAELIERLGSDGCVAAMLGLERGHVKSMRRRDSIAPEHWPRLADATDRAGLDVGLADFARWRASRSCRSDGEEQPQPEAVS